MKYGELTTSDELESQEIVRQADVELAIILGIERSLRIALQWMTRGRGNSYKLSTLRFHTWSYERHLARMKVLSDHGGYMNLITDANPHLAGEVEMLRNERAKLHADLECIIMRLDYISRDDVIGLGRICADFERFLDDQRAHGEKEREMLHHSFAREEEGGSG